MSRSLRTLAFGLLLAVCGPLSAHRGQDALTVIEIDTVGTEVFITHHFAAHDIEPLLPRLADGVAASLDDRSAQDALVTHLFWHFMISTDAGEIALAFDGLHLQGDDVRVVYRGRFPLEATNVEVRSTLGADLTAGSSHQVNVRRNGTTRTMVLEGADDTGTVSLEASTGGETQ